MTWVPWRRRPVVGQGKPGQVKWVPADPTLIVVTNTTGNVNPAWQQSAGGIWQPYQLQPINPWQPTTVTNQPTPRPIPIPDPPKEPPLPKRKQADPIVAYKRAKIVCDPWRLFGVGMHAAYNADDKAVCHYGQSRMGPIPPPKHDAPHVGCGCGFYAMPLEWLGRVAADYRDAVCDVQVELFGKVIVCERGWKAERQRVLGVWVDPVCKACFRTAVGMWEHVVPVGGHRYVMPLCKWCVKDRSEFNSKRGEVKVADLANEWGVEVRWGNLMQ